MSKDFKNIDDLLSKAKNLMNNNDDLKKKSVIISSSQSSSSIQQITSSNTSSSSSNNKKLFLSSSFNNKEQKDLLTFKQRDKSSPISDQEKLSNEDSPKNAGNKDNKVFSLSNSSTSSSSSTTSSSTSPASKSKSNNSFLIVSSSVSSSNSSASHLVNNSHLLADNININIDNNNNTNKTTNNDSNSPNNDTNQLTDDSNNKILNEEINEVKSLNNSSSSCTESSNNKNNSSSASSVAAALSILSFSASNSISSLSSSVSYEDHHPHHDSSAANSFNSMNDDSKNKSKEQITSTTYQTNSSLKITSSMLDTSSTSLLTKLTTNNIDHLILSAMRISEILAPYHRKPFYGKEWFYLKFFEYLKKKEKQPELTSSSKPYCFVLLGDSGSGKTHLCCELKWPTKLLTSANMKLTSNDPTTNVPSSSSFITGSIDTAKSDSSLLLISKQIISVYFFDLINQRQNQLDLFVRHLTKSIQEFIVSNMKSNSHGFTYDSNLSLLLNQNSDLDLTDFLAEPIDLLSDLDECDSSTNDGLNTSSFLFDADEEKNDDTKQFNVKLERKVNRVASGFIKNVLMPLNDDKIEEKLAENYNYESSTKNDDLTLNDHFILIDGIDDAILQSKRLTNNSYFDSKSIKNNHPVYEAKPPCQSETKKSDASEPEMILMFLNRIFKHLPKWLHLIITSKRCTEKLYLRKNLESVKYEKFSIDKCVNINAFMAKGISNCPSRNSINNLAFNSKGPNSNVEYEFESNDDSLSSDSNSLKQITPSPSRNLLHRKSMICSNNIPHSQSRADCRLSAPLIDLTNAAHVANLKDIQTYILKRLENDAKLKSRLVNNKTNAIELLNLLLIKSNFCVLYVEKILDLIVCDVINSNEIKNIPVTLNGFYLFLLDKITSSVSQKVPLVSDQPNSRELLYSIMGIILIDQSSYGINKSKLYEILKSRFTSLDYEFYSSFFDFVKQLILIENKLLRHGLAKSLRNSKDTAFIIDDCYFHLFHASFVDWLTDVKFCTIKYQLDLNEAHFTLALFYLNKMIRNNSLRSSSDKHHDNDKHLKVLDKSYMKSFKKHLNTSNLTKKIFNNENELNYFQYMCEISHEKLTMNTLERKLIECKVLLRNSQNILESNKLKCSTRVDSSPLFSLPTSPNHFLQSPRSIKSTTPQLTKRIVFSQPKSPNKVKIVNLNRDDEPVMRNDCDRKLFRNSSVSGAEKVILKRFSFNETSKPKAKILNVDYKEVFKLNGIDSVDAFAKAKPFGALKGDNFPSDLTMSDQSLNNVANGNNLDMMNEYNLNDLVSHEFPTSQKTQVLFSLLTKGDLNSIKVCVNRSSYLKALLSTMTDSYNQTSLLVSIKLNNYELIDYLIRLKTINLDHCDDSGWTALRYSSWMGNEVVVNSLLEHGALVDASDNEGRTALRAAVFSGHESIVKILLKFGANINKCDCENRSVLHVAVYMGHLSLVNYLILNGAFINHCDSLNRGMLSTCIYSSSFNKKIKMDIMKLLVKYGAQIDQYDNSSQTPFILASKENCFDMLEFLYQSGADVDAIDSQGYTALTHSIKNKNAQIAEYLLKKNSAMHILDKEGRSILSIASSVGSEPILRMLMQRSLDEMHRDNYGWTPLHESTFAGHVNCVSMLLNYGSEIDACDNDGKTALYYACQEGHLEIAKLLLNRGANVNNKSHEGSTSFRVACLEGRIQICDYLLNEKQIDINYKDPDGRTTLYCLIYANKNIEMAKYLLTRGALVNERDSENRTCLHLAATLGYEHFIQLLIEHNANIEARDSNDATPLLSAVWNDKLNAVKLLLDAKAFINHRDKQGATALSIACQKGNYSIARELLERGAQLYVSSRNPIKLANQGGHLEIVKLLQAWSSVYTSAAAAQVSSSGQSNNMNNNHDKYLASLIPRNSKSVDSFRIDSSKLANDTRSGFFNNKRQQYENTPLAVNQSKFSDLKRRNSINIKHNSSESPLLVRRSESFRNENPFKNKTKMASSNSNPNGVGQTKNVYEVISSNYEGSPNLNTINEDSSWNDFENIHHHHQQQQPQQQKQQQIPKISNSSRQLSTPTTPNDLQSFRSPNLSLLMDPIKKSDSQANTPGSKSNLSFRSIIASFNSPNQFNKLDKMKAIQPKFRRSSLIVENSFSSKEPNQIMANSKSFLGSPISNNLDLKTPMNSSSLGNKVEERKQELNGKQRHSLVNNSFVKMIRKKFKFFSGSSKTALGVDDGDSDSKSNDEVHIRASFNNLTNLDYDNNNNNNNNNINLNQNEKKTYNHYDNDNFVIEDAEFDEREYENYNDDYLFGEVACDDEYDFFLTNEAKINSNQPTRIVGMGGNGEKIVKQQQMTRSITYSVDNHDNRSTKSPSYLNNDLTNVSRIDSATGKTKASSILSSMTSYLINSPAKSNSKHSSPKKEKSSNIEDDVAHIFRRDSLNSCFDYRRSMGIGIGANLNYSNLNESRSNSSRFSKGSPKQSNSSFRIHNSSSNNSNNNNKRDSSIYNQIIFNKIDEITPSKESNQQQQQLKRPTQLNINQNNFKKETSI